MGLADRGVPDVTAWVASSAVVVGAPGVAREEIDARPVTVAVTIVTHYVTVVGHTNVQSATAVDTTDLRLNASLVCCLRAPKAQWEPGDSNRLAHAQCTGSRPSQ